jgi:hypothetical protein
LVNKFISISISIPERKSSFERTSCPSKFTPWTLRMDYLRD